MEFLHQKYGPNDYRVHRQEQRIRRLKGEHPSKNPFHLSKEDKLKPGHIYSDVPLGPPRDYRQIWEKEHGPIPSGYHIHHINGDHKDNRIVNLMLVTPKEHQRLHEGWIRNEAGKWIAKPCGNCGEIKPLNELRNGRCYKCTSTQSRNKNLIGCINKTIFQDGKELIRCAYCKQYKPPNEFYYSAKNGRRKTSSYCKSCTKEYQYLYAKGERLRESVLGVAK